MWDRDQGSLYLRIADIPDRPYEMLAFKDNLDTGVGLAEPNGMILSLGVAGPVCNMSRIEFKILMLLKIQEDCPVRRNSIAIRQQISPYV